MTVNEASTNDGMTLRVLDADGNHRFIDRRSAGVWIASRPRPPAAGTTGDGEFPPLDLGGYKPRKRPSVGDYINEGRHGACKVVAVHGRTGERLSVVAADGHRADVERAASGHWAVLNVPAPQAAGAVHVLSSSPTIVKLGGGREGLANPTWCGMTRLPGGERAWHTYGLKAETVTCPVCHHLYTCPWAALQGTWADKLCAVCAHIHECVDEVCNPARHQGIEPEPGPVDVQAGAVVVIARVRRALADGDLDLADALLDAGDDQRLGTVGDSETWGGLRVDAVRAREKATGPEPSRAEPAPVDHSACDHAGRRICCDRCGIEYVCTPAQDFYCTPQGDHCCEPCLIGGGPDDEAGALWGAVVRDVGPPAGAGAAQNLRTLREGHSI